MKGKTKTIIIVLLVLSTIGSYAFMSHKYEESIKWKNKAYSVTKQETVKKSPIIKPETVDKYVTLIKGDIEDFRKDELGKYKGSEDATNFLNTLFPTWAENKNEYVEQLSKYSYDFDDWMMLKKPTSNENGVMLFTRKSITLDGKDQSWSQSKIIKVTFDEKGRITGGEFYDAK